MVWKKDPNFDIAFPARDLYGWESQVIAFFGAEVQDSVHWVIEWRIVCAIAATIIAGAALLFQTYVSGVVSVVVVAFVWNALIQYEADRIAIMRKYLCEYLKKPGPDGELKNRGWA